MKNNYFITKKKTLNQSLLTGKEKNFNLRRNSMKTKPVKTYWTRVVVIIIGMILMMGTIAVDQVWADKYRTQSASLLKETPLWWQTYKSSGHPIGCGSAAWAIVFGYWKQYWGKTKLLESISMPHSQTRDDRDLARHMEEIAEIMGSTYGTYQGKKWGRSTPSKMEKACKYITKRGYRCSINRVRGTEYSKFWKVRDALKQNKPVILLINNPDKVFSSLHYVVIEKAELKQKWVMGKWRDRDVRYYANMGNGSHKWLWVREYGRNTHEHTGSFSMFFLNIH
jgi:hypothetical protein